MYIADSGSSLPEGKIGKSLISHRILDRDYKKKLEIDSKVNEIFSKTKIFQNYKNISENPIELKIYIFKKIDIILSNFSIKIGDSITVKSKIIKKEKAEEKYVDSISLGNTGIFISDDPFDVNRKIIHIGNIPPNEEIIFAIEYIQFTEVSKSYEIEIFRDLPIFQIGDFIYNYEKIKGKIEIKTKNKIIKVEKKILDDNLKIILYLLK